MPAEDNNDTKSMTLWLNKLKGLPHQEDGIAKAIQKKIAMKNMTESKPAATPKKTCICAPTKHAGSFRCHLHRNATFNAKNVGDVVDEQPRLSRFGMAASARTCHDNLPFTMAEQVK